MIQTFADWLVYGVMGLRAGSALGTAINFFFYDTIKILILLFFISIIMGIINAYFPIERLRHYLTSHRLYGLQYFLASLFGAITPFCSCSSIPLFIGFVKGGIPLGVTFAYLITSPLVNEVAVAMFIGTFGLRITVIYVVSGILLGMIGGYVLGKMKLEPYLSDWVKQIQQGATNESNLWEKEHTPFFHRLPSIIREARNIVKGVLVYILIELGSEPSYTDMYPKDSSSITWRKTTGWQFLFLSCWPFRCMPMLPASFLSLKSLFPKVFLSGQP